MTAVTLWGFSGDSSPCIPGRHDFDMRDFTMFTWPKQARGANLLSSPDIGYLLYPEPEWVVPTRHPSAHTYPSLKGAS
jgi:hypothetical protein